MYIVIFSVVIARRVENIVKDFKKIVRDAEEQLDALAENFEEVCKYDIEC